MTSILSIMDMARGSVGNQYIELFKPPQREPELAYLCPHLTLPELVGIAIVPTRPGKSEK